MKYQLFLLSLLIISCSETKVNERKKLPIQNFAFIEKEVDLITCATYPPSACIKDGEVRNGSGVFVGLNMEEGTSYVLTAEHLCAYPDPPAATLLKSSKVEDYRMIVNDSYGDKYPANILRTDKDNDLCLLELDMLSPDPVPVSQEDPELHEKVWNIAAPLAMWDPQSVIIFDGYFDGVNKKNQSVYSMPSSPGSSGSPVFNEKHELIGIISMYATNWNVGLGASRQDVANFVRVYMPENNLD